MTQGSGEPQSQSAKAVELAVADANAAEGQVNGRPVAVVRPDVPPAAAPTPATGPGADAVQALAVKLVALNRVSAIVGSSGESSAEALARVAQQSNLPVILTACVQGLSPNGFSVSPGPVSVGKALARYVKEELKKSQVVLIADNRSPRAANLKTAFAKEYENNEKGLTQWSIAASKELEDRAAQAVELKPGVVVFMGSPAEFRNLADELAKAEIPLPADVPLVLGTLELVDLAQLTGLKNPTYLATPFVSDGGDRAREFANRFKSPPGVEAALSYDAAAVVFEAMRRAKSVQGPKVREELLKLKDYECLTGPLSFDKDQCARRPIFIVRIGEDKPAKRYDPDPAVP